MKENQMKRTVKKLFLTADKVSSAVKGVGGYASTFIVGVALNTALNSKNENGDSDESEYSEGDNE